MSVNDPLIPPPWEVTLYDAKLTEYNELAILLDFTDGTRLRLEFAEDSEAVEQLLELLTRIATERLSELGSRGVVVTRPTPLEEPE